MLEQYIIIAGAEKGCNMAPKRGRPRKENPKNIELGIRLTQQKADDLQQCADLLGITRTEVIERGIELVKKSLRK